MSLFDMIRSGVGIAVFLVGLFVFVASENRQSRQYLFLGFAIMLMGGGTALVPDKNDRNG